MDKQWIYKAAGLAIAVLIGVNVFLAFGGKEGTANVASASELKFKDLEGNDFTLNELKGEKVYIKVWASWCSICLAGMGEVDQLSLEENAKSDFKVITIVSPGVNGELNEADFKEWVKGLEYKNIKVYMDQEGAGIKAFGVRAYPTSIFIDAEGNVVKTQVGHMSSEAVREVMESIK